MSKNWRDRDRDRDRASANSTIMEISTMFPGFRFSPTDCELICHYLKRKISGLDLSEDVIAEVEICKFEPWDLPDKSVIQSDHEWFFFSPNDKKYPNGSQAKRATEGGFWKATGKERTIRSGKNVIGTKRTLVFHLGRAPKGTRTDWIMHEYCVKENKDDKPQDSHVICRIRKKQDLTSKMDINCESTSHIAPEVRSNMQQLGTGVRGVGKDSHVICCIKKKQDLTSKMDINCESTSHTAPEVRSNMQQLGTGLRGVDKDNGEKSSEEDCFADILKDDIVKLDDNSLYGTPLLTKVAESSTGCSLVPQVDHFQGTAGRRIRLQRRRSRRICTQIPGARDKKIVESGRIFSSMFCGWMRCTIFASVVVLILLFMVVLLGTWSWCLKC